MAQALAIIPFDAQSPWFLKGWASRVRMGKVPKLLWQHSRLLVLSIGLCVYSYMSYSMHTYNIHTPDLRALFALR